MTDPTIQWVRVDVSDLRDEQTRAARVGGLDVLLCRVSNHIHAVENRCSHAATELADGRLRGNLLECPLHGAEFDVRTGNPTRPPARRPITTFPVRCESGQYEVGIPSDG